jgi:FtsZ-interacting cell division protein ZipA
MEKITMRSLLILVIGIGASLFLFSGEADAQYKYTDDKGVAKTTQYKADIPERYRDAAEWIGPTGIGKPALSADQQRWKQRDDAERRIQEAEAELAKYRAAERAAQQQEQQETANHQRFVDSQQEQADRKARRRIESLCSSSTYSLSATCQGYNGARGGDLYRTLNPK